MRFVFKTSPQNTIWADMLSVARAPDDIEVFKSGWTFGIADRTGSGNQSATARHPGHRHPLPARFWPVWQCLIDTDQMPYCTNSSGVTRRSCLAGNSRLLTGCRSNDHAMRPTLDRRTGVFEFTRIAPVVDIVQQSHSTLPQGRYLSN